MISDEVEKNIYLILDIEDPEEMRIKANFVAEVLMAIRHTGMKVSEVSTILKVDESIIRSVLSGQFHKISCEELKRWRDELAN